MIGTLPLSCPSSSPILIDKNFSEHLATKPTIFCFQLLLSYSSIEKFATFLIKNKIATERSCRALSQPSSCLTEVLKLSLIETRKSLYKIRFTALAWVHGVVRFDQKKSSTPSYLSILVILQDSDVQHGSFPHLKSESVLSVFKAD